MSSIIFERCSQKLEGGNGSQNLQTNESAASSPTNVASQETKDSTVADDKENKENSSASKSKRKSRFEPEAEQPAAKRKDDRCDMFAETDTFGTNVNVRIRQNCFLISRFSH